MTDCVETLGQSLIQHGPHNDRIYLMHLDEQDLPGLLPQLDELTEQKGYTKIFAKVPAPVADPFLADGYEQEAAIPDFYQGCEEALFLGKFLTAGRQIEPRPKLVCDILDTARQKSAAPAPEHRLPTELDCRIAEPADTPAMAELYREVFPTYPFPVHDPDYLAQTMAENLLYFGIWNQDRELLALSSAEMDEAGQNAEMTDFATRPECRGQGLATYLLGTMEPAMAERDIRTAYTIARAYSYGMNITFARMGYEFGGTLTRNTQISGDLESMNVWYKALAA